MITIWPAVALLSIMLGGRIYTLCAKEQTVAGRVADLVLIAIYGVAIWCLF